MPLIIGHDADLPVLLSIARLGRCLNRHLGFVWHNQVDPTTIRKTTRRLREAGLVESQRCAVRSEQRGKPPRYMGDFLIVTKEGADLLDDRFPHHNFELEKLITKGKGDYLHQAAHQIEYCDLVTSMIHGCVDIPGFVGVSTAVEIRLWAERTPRCDGFFIVRRWDDATGHPSPRENMVCNPWLMLPPAIGQSAFAYAIEIDRGTEDMHIIRAKAQSYRAVHESRYWVGRYIWPIVMWVVPTERRRDALIKAWLEEWPEALFMITTKPELDEHGAMAPIWDLFARGRERPRGEFLPREWMKESIANEKTD